MKPWASPAAVAAVHYRLQRQRSRAVASAVTPTLFEETNTVAWNPNQMRVHADGWKAIHEWDGQDYDDPPLDDVILDIS